MLTGLRRQVNPFESPVKATTSSASPAMLNTKTQEPDVLATADLFLEQLKELEDLCSTVEERVQRKRQALKELEYLIFGSDATNGSPSSPACPTNTPIRARLRFVSPRLRGLFDLHGPGQANLDATQSCLDYSPEIQLEDNLSTCEDPGHSEDWVDDDEEALLSPFDDKHGLLQSKRRGPEKDLPAVPQEGEVLESRIPRKICVRRQASTSKRLTGRLPDPVVRSTSHRRRTSVHNIKATNAGIPLDFASKGTMRRGSWKRSIMENAKTKSGTKVSSAIENESARESTTRRRERRKGLWSIYSVRSELGLGSGTGYCAI